MCEQKSNKLLLQIRNKTRLWQENVPKINVEHTKNNGEFYFYLYPSNIKFKKVS
jgi:hypothetical protein